MHPMFLITRCSSCGEAIEPTGDPDDMDSTHCDKCNQRFYEAMAAEYPYGQCHQCGAAGWLWLCDKGKQHVVFNHVEGMCGMWGDREYEPGYCDLCPAELPPLVLSDSPVDIPF